jgi:hypothetical protein
MARARTAPSTFRVLNPRVRRRHRPAPAVRSPRGARTASPRRQAAARGYPQRDATGPTSRRGHRGTGLRRSCRRRYGDAVGARRSVRVGDGLQPGPEEQGGTRLRHPFCEPRNGAPRRHSVRLRDLAAMGSWAGLGARATRRGNLARRRRPRRGGTERLARRDARRARLAVRTARPRAIAREDPRAGLQSDHLADAARVARRSRAGRPRRASPGTRGGLRHRRMRSPCRPARERRRSHSWRLPSPSCPTPRIDSHSLCAIPRP